LKTEEKTERQCGQFVADPRVVYVLLVNSAVGLTVGGNTDTAGFPAGRRMQSRNRVAAKRSGIVCSKHDRARLAGTGS
jgi:hypothetical protein